MSRTTIPVDEATKSRLDELKRDDETWDEFLTRVTADERPIESGVLTDEEAAEAKRRIREGRNRPN